MNNIIQLTERQKALINLFIETNNEDPYKWLSQEDIEQPDGYKYVNRPNDKCSAIWKDIEVIRKSKQFNKVIITKKYKYKIATFEEAENYVESLKINALKKLKRASEIEKLIDLDGQTRLFGESPLNTLAR